MKLRIRNGFVEDEIGNIVATLTDNSTPEIERNITVGSQLVEPVERFIKGVNEGSFKPKTTVREFESILKQ